VIDFFPLFEIRIGIFCNFAAEKVVRLPLILVVNLFLYGKQETAGSIGEMAGNPTAFGRGQKQAEPPVYG
jgi:hypothetical protein